MAHVDYCLKVFQREIYWLVGINNPPWAHVAHISIDLTYTAAVTVAGKYYKDNSNGILDL